jgi:ankyrin repeat protein
MTLRLVTMVAVAMSTFCAKGEVTEFFHAAADSKEDSAKTLQKLIDSGTDVNALTDDGESALHLACIYGNAAKIKALLKAGADPNFQATKRAAALDMTALTWCVYPAYIDAVEAFLADKRTNVNILVKDQKGNHITALDIALSIGDRGAEIAAMLLASGGKRYQDLLNERNDMIDL